MTLSPGEGPAETLDLTVARGVQRCLQINVERTRANAASVHRAEHLDIEDRVQTEAFGDAGLHQFQGALTAVSGSSAGTKWKSLSLADALYLEARAHGEGVNGNKALFRTFDRMSNQAGIVPSGE
jgi:hypothetical protein